tara:strand:+ start:4091 stop:4633 length:543 start_codon:yes stop_codon:yes gene_type:complete
MRYRTKEFVLATDYKPKLGKLYFIGADGNMYETTMGPKFKGYKAPMVAELNIKREKGWLYYVERNPEIEYVGSKKRARVPKDSICEVWRSLMSSEYGIADMTKKEILDEILENWEDLSKSATDESLNEDRGRWIQESRDISGEDDVLDEIEVDLQTIVFQLEQIRRFGKIIYKSEKNRKE